MNPWLIAGLLGLGAVVLLGASGTASASATSGGDWPPTAADQAGLASQLTQLATVEMGTPPTADQIAAMNANLAQAPAQYEASLLAAGQTPTVAGYRAWVLTSYSSISGGNPYVVSGPLWAFPHERRSNPILSGHGLGWG